MALNQACRGKIYPAITTEVTLDALQNYARACNDLNPRYFDSGGPRHRPSRTTSDDGSRLTGNERPRITGAPSDIAPDAEPAGIIAPPMFAVVVTWLSVITAMTDPELHADLLRLLHVAQDVEFLAPIRAGDSIVSTGKITSIEPHQNGETLTLELDARNGRGEAVTRIVFTVFIRGRRISGSVPETKIDKTNPNIDEAPLLTVTQTIDDDQTVRYAQASGDRNPIHVDANVAKMAGLPGIIVHGLCTMAFTARAIVDSLCDGDPVRLKRLAVRFSRPVTPGDTITTRVWTAGARSGRRVFGYETSNSGGLVVIRDGVAEIAP